MSASRAGSIGRVRARERVGPGRRAGLAALYLLLVLGAAFMLIPFVYALSGSLTPERDLFTVPIKWIPRVPQWQNYVLPFRQSYARYFLNSAIVSVIQTFSPLLLCSMAGYSLAKFSYPGRTVAFVFILSTIMLPLQVTLIPAFLIVKQLGWLNSYAGLIVPGLATTFGTFLMRQFFLGIPTEYLDAARIDGASEPTIYWRVMLPMIRPALAALAIFSFTGSWNSFLWPLVIVNDDQMRTIPLGIVFYFGANRVPEYGQLLAVSLLATLPVLVIFILMQRDDDYRAKMLPQLATGGGPDIFEAGEDFRYKFSASGVFAPIDYGAWGGQDQWNGFWAPGIVKALQVNGKDYVVPLEWTAFPDNYFARQDDAKAAGIPDSDFDKYQKTPITWDELPAWTAKMTVKDSQGRITRDGFMIQHGYGPARTFSFFQEHFMQLGGTMLSADGKTSTLNTDQGVAVLQYLYDLVYKTGSSMLRPQSKESGSGVLPKNQTASTTSLGFWAYPTFQQLDAQNWKNIRCLLTPQAHPDKPLYLSGPGWSTGINSRSSQVPLAFKVLHYIATNFGSQLFDGGIVTPVKDWTSKYPGVKKLPDADAWAKLANDATVYIAPTAELSTSTVRQEGFQRAFEAVMFNKADIKQEVDKWNKDVQDALNGG